MVRANTAYDCSILDASGNEIGLTLVIDKDGVPAYREYTDPSLANQIFTGIPDYGSLTPEKELQLGQDDFRAGFGLEFFDSTQPRRYYSSINCDARHRGMVIPGPLATAITRPTVTAATITDASLEVWTGNTLDNWTFTKYSTTTLTDETTIVDHGTHSA